MKKSLSFLFLSAIFHCYCSGQAPISLVKGIADELQLPGIQIVHSTPGESHSYYLGKLGGDQSGFVNSTTRFQAASLTKVVTAYVFFKLYDQKKIALDTPLYTYYRYDRIADNPQAQKITARMVLTHRTGLHNWEGDVPSKEWRNTPLHTLFEPGSQYKYSGEGFYFLQLVMEEVSGMSFSELIRDLALQPLDMTHSDIVWNKSFDGNTAVGHRAEQKSLGLKKMTTPNAAYTLYTTAEDYSKFVQKALNDGEGLKPETHQLMITKANEVQKGNSPTADDAHVPIALGVRLQLNEKGTWLWHTGSNPGFRSYFLTHPQTGESLVVFTNSSNGFKSMPLYFKLFLGENQTYWAYQWRKGELD